MPPFVMANAALDADAPIALTFLCALLTGIEAVKWVRFRRQDAAEREIKMALGGIIGGLLFTALFAAIVGFGAVIGQPLITAPRFASVGDWLYATGFLVPLLIEGCIFVRELRSLGHTAR